MKEQLRDMDEEVCKSWGTMDDIINIQGGGERCYGGGGHSAPECDNYVSVSVHHPHHPHHDNRGISNPSSASHQDRHHHRRSHHRHRQNSSNPELNDSPAATWEDGNFSHSFSPSSSSSCGGRKRQFSHSSNSLQGTSPPDYGDGSRIVKLYVAGVPKTSSHQDIASVFSEHGNIIEIFLIRDKKTGQQGECCFVKYATPEEADRAIGALHGRCVFPGGVAPLTVRYADGQKERNGSFDHQLLKLYVGCVNKQSTDTEIKEIFSPFGVVEDVFIVRDEMRQHRGCAFVRFSRREMAVAAINALHGSYIMRGCKMPLIVRFADPKKPRLGGLRTAPYYDDRVAMVPNDLHPSPNNRCRPHPLCGNDASESSLHCSSSSSYAAFEIEPTDCMDCEWSEHMCPDGYPYYYNCVTCESRWEKPEEYVLYESRLPKLECISQAEVLSAKGICQL